MLLTSRPDLSIFMIILHLFSSKPQVRGDTIPCPYRCICITNDTDTFRLFTVECNDKNLSSLPYLFGLEEKKVKVELFINKNKFRYILKSALSNLAGQLRRLEIVENVHQIEISREAFEPLGEVLEVLRLEPLFDDLNDKIALFSALTSLRELSIGAQVADGKEAGEILSVPLFKPDTSPALEVLVLHHWGLKDIRKAALQRVRLETLVLSYNKFTQIPSIVTDKMATSLTQLKMDHNEVEELKFADIPHGCRLRILDLSHNKLSVLDEGMLEKCKDLKVINLSNNPKLLKIEPGVFEGMKSLSLDLSDTNINRLDFIKPDQVNMLKIMRANMACTCELQVKYRKEFGCKLQGTCVRLVGVDALPVTFDFSSLEFDCQSYQAKQKRIREDVIEAMPQDAYTKSDTIPPVLSDIIWETEDPLQNKRIYSSLGPDLYEKFYFTSSQSGLTPPSARSPQLETCSHGFSSQPMCKTNPPSFHTTRYRMSGPDSPSEGEERIPFATKHTSTLEEAPPSIPTSYMVEAPPVNSLPAEQEPATTSTTASKLADASSSMQRHNFAPNPLDPSEDSDKTVTVPLKRVRLSQTSLPTQESSTKMDPTSERIERENVAQFYTAPASSKISWHVHPSQNPTSQDHQTPEGSRSDYMLGETPPSKQDGTVKPTIEPVSLPRSCQQMTENLFAKADEELSAQSWFFNSPLSIIVCFIHLILTVAAFLSIEHGAVVK